MRAERRMDFYGGRSWLGAAPVGPLVAAKIQRFSMTKLVYLRDYVPLDQRKPMAAREPVMQQPVTDPVRFNEKLSERKQGYDAPPSDCA